MSKSERNKSLTVELNKLALVTKVEQEVNNSLGLLNKEMHNQRLKNMRETAEKLKDDSWNYTPVEKLLGLQ